MPSKHKPMRKTSDLDRATDFALAHQGKSDIYLQRKKGRVSMGKAPYAAGPGGLGKAFSKKMLGTDHAILSTKHAPYWSDSSRRQMKGRVKKSFFK